MSDYGKRAAAFLEKYGTVNPALPPPQRPAQAAGPTKIRIPITCGVAGELWVGIAEPRGNDLLYFVGHELLQPGTGRASGEAPLLNGRYHFDAAAGWACPLCKTRDNPDFGTCFLWQCGCGNGAISCAGSVGRAAYCACGKLEDRYFGDARLFTVRGERAATATPHQAVPRATPTQTTTLSTPTLSLPRSSTLPRISGRR